MAKPVQLLPPVLIVDDSVDDLLILQWLLRKAAVGNRLIIRHSAVAAQQYLVAAMARPDSGLMPCLVLTDLQMPVLDGAEFTAWIRKQDALAGLRVFMLSSSCDEAGLRAAHAAGVDKYLPKYPQPGTFAELIAEACRAPPLAALSCTH